MKTSASLLLVAILILAIVLGVVILQRSRFDAQSTSLHDFGQKLSDQLSDSRDNEQQLQEKITVLQDQNKALLSQLDSLHSLVFSRYCSVYPDTSLALMPQGLYACSVPRFTVPRYLVVREKSGTLVGLLRQAKTSDQPLIPLTIPFVEGGEYNIFLHIDDGDGIFTPETDKDALSTETSISFIFSQGQVVAR